LNPRTGLAIYMAVGGAGLLPMLVSLLSKNWPALAVGLFIEVVALFQARKCWGELDAAT
jgi:hypothetical protein